MVFDRLRKKYVPLTPEEFIRQNFVNWIINELKFPTSLISNEVGLKLNNTLKRCDTVVYRSNGTPLLVAEFKAPYITINEDTFSQIQRYNLVLKADYIIVTNGVSLFCLQFFDSCNPHYEFLDSVPSYEEIKLKHAD